MLRGIFLLLGLAAAVTAQTEFRSPEIQADNRVTFALQAPQATAVSLEGLPDVSPVALTRSDQGIWTVTIGPLAPDIYSYYFDVDGTRVVDPRNRHAKAWLLMESAFEVVGEARQPFAQRDVPAGIVHQHRFHSEAHQAEFATYYVYTPPGYDPRGEKRYPVVFLLHGFGDDASAWHEFGRAHVIADNLIAAGEAEPAIIVMPHGHPENIPYGNMSWEHYGPANQLRMDYQMIHEILPQVDETYLTKTGRDHQAIVGLSMGGGHALGIGSHNLDTFGWVGGFSSGGTTRDFATYFAPLLRTREDPALAPHLLWIACGEDDFLIEPNRELTAWLTENEVEHVYVETAGNHRWPVWRDYWARFYPLLFRQR